MATLSGEGTLSAHRSGTPEPGYSSVEEFITHALEKELAQLEKADSEDEIKKKLKGLGYIS